MAQNDYYIGSLGSADRPNTASDEIELPQYSDSGLLSRSTVNRAEAVFNETGGYNLDQIAVIDMEEQARCPSQTVRHEMMAHADIFRETSSLRIKNKPIEKLQ